VATLNQGATLADLGISEEELDAFIDQSETVGKLLGLLRGAMNKKRSSVASLIKKEQCKLWIVVAAGNEPDGDVAALTRGRYSAIDIERMMASTEANIVRELKAYPEKIGILATVLDAKIFHLPMLATLDLVRSFATTDLRSRMKRAGLSDTASSKPTERLNKTEFAHMLRSGTRPVLTPGKGKAGSNTQEAFRKLAEIAQKNDASLNRAIGEGLKKAQLVTTFEIEKDFGAGLTRRTDISCETNGGIVRLEMMWRTKVGRADIANYTLTKLYNYGRAIGFLPEKVS
jgi:DNA (cytosine-5)-methyltransferase 1